VNLPNPTAEGDAYKAERVRLLLAFGLKLRAERERRNLSQDVLAEVANVHRTHIGALELGQREPHLSMLLILADALRAPLGILLAGLFVPRERKAATHHKRGQPAVEDSPPAEPPERTLRHGESRIFSRYGLEQLRRAGADLTDVEDFYYFCAERVAHREPVASAGAPELRHVEMLRLRLLEGLMLREVGERTGVSGTAVAQLLAHYFAIEGVPPAAKTRRAAPR
jgi:transcriptional regulator with XRE-family HTH domain